MVEQQQAGAGGAQLSHQFQAFFGPWEALPSYVPAPADPQQAERITLLVKHCLVNGPAFLATVKERQQSDPSFAFLFGGDGHPYWRWALYCATTGMSPDQPMVQQAQHPAPQQPASAAGAQLPAEVVTGFTQVLESLTSSKDSIKTSQQWFMACGQGAAAGLARMMASRCVTGVAEYDRTLHLIYLANDILFKGLAARPPGHPPAADAVASAFAPVLGPMLASAFNKGGKSEEVRVRLSKILSFWGERGVFEPQATKGMEQAMVGTEDAAAALAAVLSASEPAPTAPAPPPPPSQPPPPPPGQAQQPTMPPQHPGLQPPQQPPQQQQQTQQAMNPMHMQGPGPPMAPYPGGRMGYPGMQPNHPNQHPQMFQGGPAGPHANPWGMQPQHPMQGYPQGGPLPPQPWQQQQQQQHPMPPGQPYPGQGGPGGYGMPPSGAAMQHPQGTPWGMAPSHGGPPPPFMGHGQLPPGANMANHQPPMHAPMGGWGFTPHPHGQPGPPPAAHFAPPPDQLHAHHMHMDHTSQFGHASQDSRRQRDMSSSRSRSPSSSGSRSRSRSSSPSSPPPPTAPRVSKFHSAPAPGVTHPNPSVAAAVAAAAAMAAAAAAVAGPKAAAEPEEAEGEPVSSFNFPPGLLPALCQARRESGAKPYEPLDPVEIEAMGLPPPPEKGNYLASRLEHFFAEVRDFRPGLTRADIEDPQHSWHRTRLRQELDRDPEGLKQRWWRGGGRRHGGGRGEGKVYADGTFSGSGSMYAGLGTHVLNKPSDAGARETSPQPGGLGLGSGGGGADPSLVGLGAAPVMPAVPVPSVIQAPVPPAPTAISGAGGGSTPGMTFEDMYQSYRSVRSGGYHAMLQSNAAKAYMASGGPVRTPKS